MDAKTKDRLGTVVAYALGGAAGFVVLVVGLFVYEYVTHYVL